MNPIEQLKSEKDKIEIETKRKLVNLLRGIIKSSKYKDSYKYDIDNLKILIYRTYISGDDDANIFHYEEKSADMPEYLESFSIDELLDILREFLYNSENSSKNHLGLENARLYLLFEEDECLKNLDEVIISKLIEKDTYNKKNSLLLDLYTLLLHYEDKSNIIIGGYRTQLVLRVIYDNFIKIYKDIKILV